MHNAPRERGWLAEKIYRFGGYNIQMAQQEEGLCFTVCVFQDSQWASRGLAALTENGFSTDRLSLVAQRSEDIDVLIEKTFGVRESKIALEIAGLGDSVAHGPLVGTLQGSDNGLNQAGVAATMRRAGFQDHDGFIFETLTGRGGVLVAAEGEMRAADALALFHAYGGGNAAIGAWRGRV